MEQTVLDEHAIKRLLDAWGLWRDTCRFDALRACYAPGATMVTTWFDGPADAFVDASIRSSSSKTLTSHAIGPSTIDVRGDRAIAETRLTLMGRAELEGVEVDVTCYGRVYDRLVRTDDGWRLLSRVPIYEKDTMVGVDPLRPPRLDQDKLASFPAGFRHVAYVQSLAGAKITEGIPAHNSDAQRALYAAGEAWLQEA